jgi:hypothetical protein
MRGNVQELYISVYVFRMACMKTISFTLSADGENLGGFTLDSYTQLRLMADAKANKGLTLPEVVREALRNVILRDDYNGQFQCVAEDELSASLAKISEELYAAAN